VAALLVLAAAGLLGAAATEGGAACFCDDPSLCKPLGPQPPRPEIFVFSIAGDKWPFYNYSTLTTASRDDALWCSSVASYAIAQQRHIVS
jgi:hypothetical protein